MISKFKLGAVEWKVKINNDELSQKGCYGLCDYDGSLITLQNKSNGVERQTESIENTLYHEVTHAILDTLGYHELSSDEKLVQQVGTLFHQFEKTKK